MGALEPYDELCGLRIWVGFCPDFDDPIFTKFCVSGNDVFGTQEATIAGMLDGCRCVIIALASNEREHREIAG